jgi:hypothetical protein
MRRTFRFHLVLILGVGALLTTGVFSRAYSLCLSDKPEAILDCISEAYAARDSSLYRELFADDCRFFFGSASASWGVEKDYSAAKVLFGSATKVEGLFPDRGIVVPGEGPRTWILSGVATLLKFDAIKDGKPQHFEVESKGHVLRVRQVTEPKPHLVIYGWWQAAN